MTKDELDAAKAAFLARGGAVRQAPAAAAYGVDPEADRAKRKVERSFEPCRSCPWPASCRARRGCEADG